MTEKTQRRRFSINALPISVKVTLAVAILLLLGGVIADRFVTQIVRDTTTQQWLERLESDSRSTAFRVTDTIISKEITELNRIATGFAVQNRVESLSMERTAEPELDAIYEPDVLVVDFIESFRSVNAEFESIVVVDSSGTIVGMDPAPFNLSMVNPDQWNWFEEAYNTGAGDTYVDVPALSFDGLTNRYGVQIAIPIYGSEQTTRAVGVVYGILSFDSLAEFIQQFEEQDVTIVERDTGQIQFTTRPDNELLDEAIITQLQQRPSGSFEYIDQEGAQFLYGFTSFESLGVAESTFDDLNWVISTWAPIEQVNQEISVLLLRLRLILILYSVLVAIFVLATMRQILRPLLVLTNVASKLEAGDLEQEIPRFPLDEVGRLADVIRELVKELVLRVERLQSVVQVSHNTAQTLDVNEVLDTVTDALVEHFDYVDARVYLNDQVSRRSWLRAASGAEAERLKGARHNVPLDDTSIVGRAIMLQETQTSPGKDTVRKDGSTYRRKEVALPLRAGATLLGALYVCSEEVETLTPEDIDVLTLITDQLSASIENARLFEQSASNVTEIEALNRRLTRQAWEDYLGDSGHLRHTLDPDQRWPEALDTVRQQTDVHAETYADADGRNVLAAPLILRGETVGTLAVSRPPEQSWSQDEAAIMEAVASRMALIAEGIRLVEESSRRAEREQVVNEVSADMLQRAASVDNVLQTALNKLGDALGSDTVSLRLGPPPVEHDRQITDGGDHRANQPEASASLNDQMQPPAESESDGNKPGMNGDGGADDD